ncbi:MAG: hypothetical protein CHACPFDD_01505 [Phycisphaerae bacterium]|nr:hypothetical protein [Phycisphaerae bacterium]
MPVKMQMLALASVLFMAMATACLPHAHPPVLRLEPEDGPDVERWFAERRSEWGGFAYRSLRERSTIESLARRWIGRRFPGPAINDEALARDLSAFLCSLAAESADEYLKWVQDDRCLRSDAICEDEYFRRRYRQLCGRELPLSTSARELLGVFWAGHRDAPGHPTEVAEVAYLQVATTRALDATHRDPDVPIWQATYPQFSMFSDERVHGLINYPISQGFLRLTTPRVLLAQLVSNGASTDVCFVILFTRTANETYMMVNVYLYRDRGHDKWYVEWATQHHWMPSFWTL